MSGGPPEPPPGGDTAAAPDAASPASVDGAARAPSPSRARGAASPRRAAGAPSARRLAREFALMGLYQWLVAGGAATTVDADMRERDGFAGCDSLHFDTLLRGAIAQAASIDERLARHLDRRTELLSPVEHAVLMIGIVEFKDCVDIPYRVVINEAVELAKGFGGTDGHKYVHGVLDRCGAELRPHEARARPGHAPSRRPPTGPTGPTGSA